MMLEKNRLPASPENITRLLDAYLTFLGAAPRASRGCVLPGIVGCWIACGDAEGLRARAADRKPRAGRGNQAESLPRLGVFRVRCFCRRSSRSQRTPQIRPRSRRRRPTGKISRAERIFVIGDTPRDIECGKAVGARTVAIATGNYSRAELAAHNPDFLFDDLSGYRRGCRRFARISGFRIGEDVFAPRELYPSESGPLLRFSGQFFLIRSSVAWTFRSIE